MKRLAEDRMAHGAEEIGNLLALEIGDCFEWRISTNDDRRTIRFGEAGKANSLDVGTCGGDPQRRIVAGVGDLDRARRKSRRRLRATVGEHDELYLDAVFREFLVESTAMARQDEFEMAGRRAADPDR